MYFQCKFGRRHLNFPQSAVVTPCAWDADAKNHVIFTINTKK